MSQYSTNLLSGVTNLSQTIRNSNNNIIYNYNFNPNNTIFEHNLFCSDFRKVGNNYSCEISRHGDLWKPEYIQIST
jgi:hypothetical protein